MNDSKPQTLSLAARLRTLAAGTLAATLVTALVGCVSPMEQAQDEALRIQIKLMKSLYSDSIADAKPVTLSRNPSTVETVLSPERKAQLDAISGSDYYNKIPIELGTDLAGSPETKTVKLSLKEAVRMSVENNLRSKAAKLLPAVAQAQITQAEAAFDATFFTNLDQTFADTPRPLTTGSLSTTGQYTNTTTLTTGIKKNLSTGGQITTQTSFSRKYESPSINATNGTTPFLSYYEANVGVFVNQPLLRGFGSDVVRAQVLLSENAMDQANQDVRTSIMQVAVDAETAYWNIVFARAQLRILTDYATKIKEIRDIITTRGTIGGGGFDVEPSDITEANARYDQAIANIIRARQSIRQASDQLKQLINNDEIPLASEVLIVPVDVPVDAPIKYSLLDSVSVALRNRPEIKKALSQIDDATIRTRVADNGRLPQLNASAGIRYNGLGKSVGSAYGTVTDGNYIDYLLGMQFEVPIGNRGPEAVYTQSLLARQGSVLSYQKTSQDVVLQVKSALRTLLTNYELIGALREQRRSAADSYRSTKQKFDQGEPYTPAFLDLLFRRAQSDADAQIQEIQSLTGYNASISQFYQTLGTLMEYNGINFLEDQPARRAAANKPK
jgi:outer membrane protein